MPSYFFHLKVDLIRPVSGIGDLVKRDSRLLNYRKTSSQELVEELAHVTFHEPRIAKDSTDAGLNDRQINLQDWRVGTIRYEIVDMLSAPADTSAKDSGSPAGSIRTGLSSIYPGLATKARFEPTEKSEEELGYGIVRLFRDTDETPGLYDLLSTTKTNKHAKKNIVKKPGVIATDGGTAFKDEDCTTLCILTIPTWWDVARLLAFLGEDSRDNVSHFRMIRTETAGRYMLLMKFRNGKTAREWRKEWNGKVFDPASPTEYCQVVFVRSVEIRELDGKSTMDTVNDPFIDHESSKEVSKAKQLPSIASLGSKPLPPPTKPLQEMPTCPVCLERMDDSSGLLTIPCQHTFHCDCLVKWRKNGCPVCRFTQDDIVRRGSDQNDSEGMNECSICRSDVNLWICLICGNIGCGRYDGAHAYLHWKQTGHSFSLDMTDQRIWDYASDGYVHRIMQNKIDGKMMELPSAAGDYDNQTGDEDVIPKAKFEAMGAEYTQLLMSQLDSQRTYYEQKLETAADKAAEASRSAAQASDAVAKVVEELSSLQASHNTLIKTTIPSLERDRDRAARRANKFEETSRKMEKSWREEKAHVESLLEKTAHLEKEVKKNDEEFNAVVKKCSELEETNHDLMSFVSGQQKLRELNDPDIKEGTIVVLKNNDNGNDAEDESKADKKKRRKHKKRGKGGRQEALAALGKGKTGTSGEESRSGTASEIEDHLQEGEDDTEGKGKENAVA